LGDAARKSPSPRRAEDLLPENAFSQVVVTEPDAIANKTQAATKRCDVGEEARGGFEPAQRRRADGDTNTSADTAGTATR